MDGWPTTRKQSSHPLQKQCATGPSDERRRFQAGSFARPIGSIIPVAFLRYFFNPAVQFWISVSGGPVFCSGAAVTRKRWPSGETSY
jgi:hypothetical protein